MYLLLNITKFANDILIPLSMVMDVSAICQQESINQHELAMAPHIQSSGAPEIQ